jgi:NAD(P)-dependent dehydrogenase (short-subunit alcohol dehydrogenase family)
MKNIERVCLITGATSGIGLATAARMAQAGFGVVLVGRNETRARAAAQQVHSAAPAARVEYLLADLSSVADTRRLAAEFARRHSRLDVLINDAGGIFSRRAITCEGLEYTFALNHMSYFVLTTSLLGMLHATGNARVVNVASDLHRKGKLNLDDLQLEHGYSGLRAYNQSKLANVLFTAELARRLVGSRVTANCLHPGVVATGFGHNNRGLIKWYVTLTRRFLLTPEAAAATPVYLATSPDVADVSGKYFQDCQQLPASEQAGDAALARRLWERSSELCDSISPPRVTLRPTPSVRPPLSIRSVA